MRINPLHDSTCHNRIGMYREGQCTDGPHVCPFLSECDQHYDPETGEWDYPIPDDFDLACNVPEVRITEGGVYDKEIADQPFRDS